MDLDQPLFGMPPAEEYPALRENPALYRLLCKGTHSDPARRFHSAEELMEQLQGVLRLCAGGIAGVPVHSRHFVAEALTSTGRLGRRGITALEEQDAALQTLRQGDLALHAGELTRALNTYQQAAQANPHSIDACVRLVETLIEQDKLAEAGAMLARLQQLAPQHWKTIWSQALF
jgi:serine/threonine-protein kinase PknG